jgi:hypothetical protein
VRSQLGIQIFIELRPPEKRIKTLEQLPHPFTHRATFLPHSGPP